jgi:hypothetical protein
MYKYLIPALCCLTLLSCKKNGNGTNTYAITSPVDTIVLIDSLPTTLTLSFSSAPKNIQLKETTLPSFIKTVFDSATGAVTFTAPADPGVTYWGVYKATISSTNSKAPCTVWVKYEGSMEKLHNYYVGWRVYHPSGSAGDSATAITYVVPSSLANNVYVTQSGHNDTLFGFLATVNPMDRTFIIPTQSRVDVVYGSGRFYGGTQGIDTLSYNYVFRSGSQTDTIRSLLVRQQ